MSKERLTSFFDATLAIIMTILVLELDPPEQPTLQALWDLRVQFFSYGLSFFWLGTMWVHLVQSWSTVETVDLNCLWWALLVLFFSSLIPFATSFVNDFYGDTVPEILYVALTLIITMVNMGLNRALRKANHENEDFSAASIKRRNKLRVDLLIKASGLLIALVWPRFALLPVLAALIYVIV